MLSHREDTEKVEVCGHSSESLWRGGHHGEEVESNGAFLRVVQAVGELQRKSGKVR